MINIFSSKSAIYASVTNKALSANRLSLPLDQVKEKAVREIRDEMLGTGLFKWIISIIFPLDCLIQSRIKSAVDEAFQFLLESDAKARITPLKDRVIQPIASTTLDYHKLHSQTQKLLYQECKNQALNYIKHQFENLDLQESDLLEKTDNFKQDCTQIQRFVMFYQELRNMSEAKELALSAQMPKFYHYLTSDVKLDDTQIDSLIQFYQDNQTDLESFRNACHRVLSNLKYTKKGLIDLGKKFEPLLSTSEPLNRYSNGKIIKKIEPFKSLNINKSDLSDKDIQIGRELIKFLYELEQSKFFNLYDFDLACLPKLLRELYCNDSSIPSNITPLVDGLKEKAIQFHDRAMINAINNDSFSKTIEIITEKDKTLQKHFQNYKQLLNDCIDNHFVTKTFFRDHHRVIHRRDTSIGENDVLSLLKEDPEPNDEQILNHTKKILHSLERFAKIEEQFDEPLFFILQEFLTQTPLVYQDGIFESIKEKYQLSPNHFSADKNIVSAHPECIGIALKKANNQSIQVLFKYDLIIDNISHPFDVIVQVEKIDGEWIIQQPSWMNYQSFPL